MLNLNKPSDAPSNEVCWFCERSMANRRSEIEIPMYGDVQRQAGRVHFKNLYVQAPRCEECNRRHARAASTGFKSRLIIAGVISLGSILGCVVGIKYYHLLPEDSAPWVFLASLALLGVSVFIARGFMLRSLIYRLFDPKGIKPEESAYGHPSVRLMVSQGWRIGNRPGGTVQE